MVSAITALSWELMASCRWRLWVTATCLVLLCLIGMVLPEAWRSEELAGWLVVGLTTPILLMLDAFARVDGAKLEDTGSLFPVRLYTLPVASPILAGPPLVLGTLLLVGSWIACSVCLLRPWRMAPVPLFWPGLTGAAVLACVQAIVWLPFSLRWLRAAVLTVVLPGLLFGSIFLAERGTSETLMNALALSVLLLAYASALIGVSQGRRGVGVSSEVQVGAVRVASDQAPPPPFRSPLRAQMWLERRRLSSGFLLMTGICVLFSLGMVCLCDFVVGKLTVFGRVEDLDDSVATLRDSLLLYGRSWFVLSQLPLLPLLICASIGGSTLGKLTSYVNHPQPSPFLATRPMDTSEMVRAKLLTCAQFIAILWCAVFLTGFLWAAVMGRLGEMSEYLITWTGSVPAAVLLLFAGIVLLPVLSWLWLVSGWWVGVLRGGLLEGLPAFLTIGLLIFTIMLMSGKLDSWLPLIGAVIALALIGKLFAVAWVVQCLRRARLADARTLTGAIAGWCLLAGVILTLAVWLFSAGLLAAAFVVLLLPLARPLAAPIALARHRTQ